MSYEILTDEQYEEAERIALRSIGRGWAMALPKKERFLDATREEIAQYKDTYDNTIRHMMELDLFD